ncbi:rho guanine nucleotide exchange factor 26 isoform X2 [Nematostella vectensis]|uniref:rho guanine nucleotide exchange factor 26 isoform X2 n=1 Tax=Nematostella vectensis TaxID=45351 RepID=UPI002076E3AA|nr:rho guanine nucleotide exchange factor 26 isoform X2 [Nematostella vectensis]
MCDSTDGASSDGGVKSITLPTPRPKPRPPAKPLILPKSSTISTKPPIKPKPAVRRVPPPAPKKAPEDATSPKRNEAAPPPVNEVPPPRPVKPRHLQQEEVLSSNVEVQNESNNGVLPCSGPISQPGEQENHSQSVDCNDNEDHVDDIYDDVESVIPDENDTKESLDIKQQPQINMSSKSIPTAKPKHPPPKKPPPQLTKPSTSSKPPLPSKPPPALPNTVKQDTPHNSEDLKASNESPCDATSTLESPGPSPRLRVKSDSARDDMVDSAVSQRRGKKKPDLPAKPKIIIPKQASMDLRCRTVTSSTAIDITDTMKKKRLKPPVPPPPYTPKQSKASVLARRVLFESNTNHRIFEKRFSLPNLSSPRSKSINIGVLEFPCPGMSNPSYSMEEDDGWLHITIDDPVEKKRIATRRQLPASMTVGEPTKSDTRNRRPPPPPPTEAEESISRGSLPAPPVPQKGLPRSGSAHGSSSNEGVNVMSKSHSTEDFRRSAEEQAMYSYAYEHAFLPPLAPSSGPTPSPPPTKPQEDPTLYTEPCANAVAGFMEELKNKPQEATYEVPADESVAEFVESLATNKPKSKTESMYEVPAEESVNGFVESIAAKGRERSADNNKAGGNQDAAEYIGSNRCSDEVDDGASSSSYDSEHDYEMPPEEDHHPPELAGIAKKTRGSYDITQPAQDSAEENDYLEVVGHEDFAEHHEETSRGFETPSDDSDDSGDDYEEPLYQVYAARTLERDRTLSRDGMTTNAPDMSLEELTQGTLRNMRMLWCELPEVMKSGVLETIDPTERKRQEAMFEVITSEASYLKSLNILGSHFMDSPELQADTAQSVVEKSQQRVLFGNVKGVLEASEKFLTALRQRQRKSYVISTISDIIEEHATQYFDIYIKYCSHQVYQDRILKELGKNPRFVEAVRRLEQCSTAQCLSFQSFLVLPMQRITRLPLLVDAICHRCEEGSDEFVRTDKALKSINKVVHDCNEGARKMERMEELIALQPLIEFAVKPVALVSSNRWLLRRGEVLLVTEEFKSPLRKKIKTKPVYMFLFNDLLLMCKKKSDIKYRVLDYANRNMTKVEVANEPSIQMKYLLSLILLENSNGKTKDFLICAESETDKTRWLDAFSPPKAEHEGERVYGAWDCPQVQAIHNYTPQQPDELALHEGDVINVLRKLPDGWYHGERLCDGVQGWFPANHTENIRNEHIRARNLLQRYRLLAASKHLISATMTMKAAAKSNKSVKGIL